MKIDSAQISRQAGLRYMRICDARHRKVSIGRINPCLYYRKHTSFSSGQTKPSIIWGYSLDCKTVGFFLKISKEIGKAWRKESYEREPHKLVGLVTREKKNFGVSPQSRSLFSAPFQTFCLTARAYLNTQKYELFWSLGVRRAGFDCIIFQCKI